MNFRSCIYAGKVVHKRLSPAEHGFAYRVVAVCLDLDELDLLDRNLRLFSRGKWNLTSFHDQDVGEPVAKPSGDKIRSLLRSAGLERFSSRIQLLCYPRILGFVFNPLSVYFCRDKAGEIGAVVYEVTNTFGERKSYLIETPGSRSAPLIRQFCNKELYVSPFTESAGSYSFHIVPPDERVVVGVAFREQSVPVLKTHFCGRRLPLNDAVLAKMLVSHPLMTIKVVSAIHFEAARLWAKGVPLVPRHKSADYSVTMIKGSNQEPLHA